MSSGCRDVITGVLIVPLELIVLIVLIACPCIAVPRNGR